MIFLFDLFFPVPTWFIILAFLAGLLYSGVLYFRDTTFGNTSHELFWKRLMASARFLLVTFLVILLLSPFVRSAFTEIEDPIIILLHDDSESVSLISDGQQLEQYLSNWNNLKGNLEQDFDLRVWSFGEQLNENFEGEFNQRATDIAGALSGLNQRYINQNIGAIVLASDGIYNRGRSPMYIDQRLPAPVFTIALGDTLPRMDVKVENVRYNRIVYSGDRFNVLVDVPAYNMEGEQTQLRLLQVVGGREELIEAKDIVFNSNHFLEEFEFILSTESPGLQRYRIRVDEVEGEFTLDNNTFEFFVEVLDNRQRIAIFSHSPHPDLAAIKASIEKNENYAVHTKILGNQSDIPGLDTFDLVILHQIPNSSRNFPELFTAIQRNNLPVWFILGTQSDIRTLNSIQNLVKIENPRGSNEVTSLVNEQFALFTLSSNFRSVFRRLPPLKAPYGQYSLSGNARVLMYQRLGSVDTDFPLMAFGQDGNRRLGVLSAEGIWRWRMYDFLQNNNQEKFDEFIQKSIQYLAVKEDRRRFRAYPLQNIFTELEQVRLNANLFNEAFEMVNESEVTIEIIDEEGNTYPFSFSRTSNAYSLNAGFFPSGSYSYTASTTLAGVNYSYEGVFVVDPVQLEALQTMANHSLLFQLSEQTAGEMFYPEQLNSLQQAIQALPGLRPVMYSNFETRPVINLKWLFFVLMGLLSLEWFFRKFRGGY